MEVDSCGGIIDIDDWPNCSIPDCEYKSCRSLRSDKCFAHTHGHNPELSFEEYMRRGVTKDGDCDD